MYPTDEHGLDILDDVGNLLTAVDRHDDHLNAPALFDELRAILAEAPRRQPKVVDSPRLSQVRVLIERIGQLLSRTAWTAREFRSSIGCEHSAVDLYESVDLARCVAFLGLLEELTNVEDDQETNRDAIVVALEAFRLALGDVELTRTFWSDPLPGGAAKTAAEFVRSADPSAALLVVAGHASGRNFRVPLRPATGLRRWTDVDRLTDRVALKLGVTRSEITVTNAGMLLAMETTEWTDWSS